MIDRDLADVGTRVTTTFGIPVSAGAQQYYTATGWYAVNPTAVIQLQPDPTVGVIGPDKTDPSTTDYGPTAAAIAAQNTQLIEEGVGEGFYFGPDGGGAAYQVHSKTAVAQLVSIDNPAPQFPASVAPSGNSTGPAVPTVFNGDFSYGLNQSLVTYLAYFGASNPTPAGRFPASYQLPGWSFDGGHGFVMNVGALAPLLGTPTIDLTGLFAVQIDPATFLTTILSGWAQKWVEQIVNNIVQKAKFDWFTSHNASSPIAGEATGEILDGATNILIQTITNVIATAVSKGAADVLPLGDLINNVLGVDPAESERDDRHFAVNSIPDQHDPGPVQIRAEEFQFRVADGWAERDPGRVQDLHGYAEHAGQCGDRGRGEQ